MGIQPGSADKSFGGPLPATLCAVPCSPGAEVTRRAPTGVDSPDSPVHDPTLSAMLEAAKKVGASSLCPLRLVLLLLTSVALRLSRRQKRLPRQHQ